MQAIFELDASLGRQLNNIADSVEWTVDCWLEPQMSIQRYDEDG